MTRKLEVAEVNLAADILPTTINKPSIKLFTPMTLPAYADFGIVSDSPFRVHIPGVNLVAYFTTTSLFVNMNKPVWIEPIAPLGPGFATRWNTLPTELKEMVLESDLIVENAIWRKPWPKRKDEWKRLAPPWVQTLCAYLLMTPEIATLAKEVFWKKNRFVLDCAVISKPSGRPPNIRLKSPQVPHPNFLRRIQYKLVQNSSCTSDKLKFLNRSLSGFPRLQDLRILMQFQHHWVNNNGGTSTIRKGIVNYISSIDETEFEVPGQVDVEGENWVLKGEKWFLEGVQQVHGRPHGYENLLREVEQLLRLKITFTKTRHLGVTLTGN
jgi:hypothetical protein